MLSRPLDLEGTLRLASQPGVRVFAGGTDIFPAAGDVELQGDFLDLGLLPTCKGIRHADGFIRIGASVTWAEIIATDLPPAFAALKAAAREIGSLQIQSRGTLAGNLCNASPAADGVPALLILDAQVELQSTRGLRRLSLADFITGNRRTLREPDEIMTAILVPTPRPSERSTFHKARRAALSRHFDRHGRSSARHRRGRPCERSAHRNRCLLAGRQTGAAGGSRPPWQARRRWPRQLCYGSADR